MLLLYNILIPYVYIYIYKQYKQYTVTITTNDTNEKLQAQPLCPASSRKSLAKPGNNLFACPWWTINSVRSIVYGFVKSARHSYLPHGHLYLRVGH